MEIIIWLLIVNSLIDAYLIWRLMKQVASLRRVSEVVVETQILFGDVLKDFYAVFKKGA
jgi:hypothetical protein